MVVALGGVATTAAAVQPPMRAQMDDAGNQGGFTVTELSAPSGAAPGDEVEIAATLTNPTDQPRTEQVELRFGGDVVARTTVSLDPGASTTLEAAVNTTDIEAGEYVYAVFAASNGQVGQLTLSESFALDSLDAPSTVTAGDNVTVTATVSNPNGFATTQPIEFRFDGSLLAAQNVTIEGDSSTTVTFEVPTAGVPSGTYFHGVFTRDGGAFAGITVQAVADADASVAFDDQLSDGTTVTVSDVTLPRDGYVAIHDDSLLEGNVVGSVIGVSEYQEAGQYENLSVTLYDVPGATFNETELTENQTLIAMPHEETGNNTAYDFVATNGTEDGPFLVDDQPVTDSAEVSVAPENVTPPAPTPANASVTFENQTSDGTTVTVQNVTVPDDGYVAIHDDSLLEGNVVGSVIGVSEFLDNGTYENLSVTLYDVPGATFNETELTENQTLIAMPHEETGNNTVYDFVATNGTEDGPFLVDGQPVVDSGLVTLTAPPEPPVDNGTDGNGTPANGDETPTDGEEPPVEGTPAEGTPAANETDA